MPTDASPAMGAGPATPSGVLPPTVLRSRKNSDESTDRSMAVISNFGALNLRGESSPRGRFAGRILVRPGGPGKRSACWGRLLPAWGNVCTMLCASELEQSLPALVAAQRRSYQEILIPLPEPRRKNSASPFAPRLSNCKRVGTGKSALLVSAVPMSNCRRVLVERFLCHL